MIYWDLILKSDNPKATLRALYDSATSVQALADYLGVSKNALMKIFKQYGIHTRARGGPHPSWRKDLIPENAAELTAAQLAKVTGYTQKYCEKLLMRLHKEA